MIRILAKGTEFWNGNLGHNSSLALNSTLKPNTNLNPTRTQILKTKPNMDLYGFWVSLGQNEARHKIVIP